jgi:putative transposase
MILAIIMSLRHLLGWVVSAFRSRENLILENLALCQPVLALHAKRPRGRLTDLHKLFCLTKALVRMGTTSHPGGTQNRCRLASGLLPVVLDMGFKSRRVGGRRWVSKEVRALIFRIAAENPTWGAPRIHGELLKLGFHLSETTVSRWLRRIPRTPDPAVKFLRNHRQLQPWTSSRYRRSRVAFCIASLS